MPDYGKLIDEEKQRQDSAIAAAERNKAREIELVAFFREVEIELGIEMAKANVELKKRAAPLLFGPFRPIRDQEKIEFAFGLRNPCCRLTLRNTDALPEVSVIRAELLQETGSRAARLQFAVEGEKRPFQVYRMPVEGFPDVSVPMSPAEIAQEIVSGILRGRFD